MGSCNEISLNPYKRHLCVEANVVIIHRVSKLDIFMSGPIRPNFFPLQYKNTQATLLNNFFDKVTKEIHIQFQWSTVARSRLEQDEFFVSGAARPTSKFLRSGRNPASSFLKSNWEKSGKIIQSYNSLLVKIKARNDFVNSI